MDVLTVRYEHSRDDDFGWLELAVTTGDFQGQAGAFVQWQELEEFSYLLSAHPIAAEAPVRGEWGDDPHTKDDGNLAIAVERADRNGLDVTVTVASYYREEMRRLTTRFRTGDSELRDFARALRKMVKKEGDEAVLTGR